MKNLDTKISAIVTFHSEGLLAHTALNSYSLSRHLAREQGVDVELVLILDKADALTSSVVQSHPALDGSEILVHVSVGDLALARNAGVDAATGSYIATLDGDDLISRRYFLSHVEEARKQGDEVILHPEMVLSFGMYNAFNWQVDQAGEYFNKSSLLTINPWISAAFAHAETFKRVPYEACHPQTTGFGFEDWYWNCETISKGFVHRLAWGAVYFYRRKWSGSLNESSRHLQTVMPKSRLFEVPLDEVGAAG